jgi:hypothetical protein
MFGKAKTQSALQNCDVAMRELSAQELAFVSGAGDLDSCTIKCSNDPNVTNNTQLSICVDKCVQTPTPKPTK